MGNVLELQELCSSGGAVGGVVDGTYSWSTLSFAIC